MGWSEVSPTSRWYDGYLAPPHRERLQNTYGEPRALPLESYFFLYDST